MLSMGPPQAAEQFQLLPSLRWLPLWAAGLCLRGLWCGDLGDPLGGPRQGGESTRQNHMGMMKKEGNMVDLRGFTKKNWVLTCLN